ncbi:MULTISPECIES: hypothetical protein [Wolbachia]|uniref:Uncharacterized protein n=1 Tax=Wolbachia endosymbiont of Ephestia elutella TaxID=3231696 RepID=A0AAU8MIV1_9RICK|nr:MULTISPECIES: hypothetical protein [Wolbachia]MBS9531171.1 hypothetical protein [Wolbachia endosymbiont of Rhagoletis cerasi]UFO00320.1 hypothetical protein LOK48_06145 [Wolbachia endosymbiont of Corcyra cephalonica]BDG76813.1 hypothetical protein wHmt_13710 [Wolbachia pipientis]BDG78115.1 hypothetical protein wHmc_12470 [Wolbachia pipientis]
MKSNTKSAAAYNTREEAYEQYYHCIRACPKSHQDNNELRSACISKCRESDWSFEQDVKFSDQLNSITSQLQEGLNDLSELSSDLNLMKL